METIIVILMLAVSAGYLILKFRPKKILSDETGNACHSCGCGGCPSAGGGCLDKS